jgi:Asp-tRNA(Asn)/Glu-tRNA(Gln) amidotransferase A subunit family amidase
VLRGVKALEGVNPRYDPTVIPKSQNEVVSTGMPDNLALAERGPASDVNGRFWSVADYHEAYKSGKLTPLQVAEALLPLIRRDVPNKADHSTAFMNIKADEVIKAAEASTQRWKEGKPLGLLDGVPCAVKDEFDIKGHERHVGSKRTFETLGTSWCAQKCMDAGAIVVGKTTMHELGLDTTNNNPNYGTPLNPYNRHYYTGGSSGGSAYAVGAGLMPFALGADGGGSIRIPSSFCGIFGLKTSHGRVSRLPTSNLAESTGVVGPMAANMVDLEASWRVMAQPDPSHSASPMFPPAQRHTTDRNKVLGIYKPWFDRAEPSVKAACQKAIDYLTSDLGYSTVDITIPFTPEGQLAHAMTILSEIASGIPDVTGLTAPNKVLLTVGSKTPAIDLLQAQKMRNLLMKHLAWLYKEHPGLIIVTPSTPIPGWHIAGGPGDLKYGVSDGNKSVRNMEYVWLANFCGNPCLQGPVGYVDPVEGQGKVPVGIMGMSEWGSDDTLIEFGYDIETWLNKGLDGGRRRPDTWVDTFEVAGASK